MGPQHRAFQEAPRLKLSIVVPAYNEERLLPAALASIRAAAEALGDWRWELIVCDNNSTDRTAEIAREAGARVVFEPHNQIARARNRGAAAAAGEWLLFIDADSAPGAALFEDLKLAIESGRCLGGGSTIEPEGPFGFRFAIRGWNAVSRTMHWAAGAFVFCRRDVFAELGGFSQELYASEELELSRRLKAQARQRSTRFVILHRHPLRTSDRKIRLYGWGGLLRYLGRFLLHPQRSLRNAEDCAPWYDGRR